MDYCANGNMPQANGTINKHSWQRTWNNFHMQTQFWNHEYRNEWCTEQHMDVVDTYYMDTSEQYIAQNVARQTGWNAQWKFMEVFRMELATTVYGHNVYSWNTWQWQCVNAEWRPIYNEDESNYTRQAHGQHGTWQLESLLCNASYDLMNGYRPKLWVLNTTHDSQRYVLHIHSMTLIQAGNMFSLSFTLQLERLLFETIAVDTTTWTHAVRWWL